MTSSKVGRIQVEEPRANFFGSLDPLVAACTVQCRSTVDHMISIHAPTTMSGSLPQEILDLIVDHLYNHPPALKVCCLTSKSLIPCARKHLFAEVKLSYYTLMLWMKAFPDPSNSPAHYTHILSVDLHRYAADADPCPWILAFHRTVKLGISAPLKEARRLLVRLPGLSPTLTSLHVYGYLATLPELSNFICSFPLLEDLSLDSPRPEINTNDVRNTPSTSPKLNGSLLSRNRVVPVVLQLLDFPGGLHFVQIETECYIWDVWSVRDLVSKCSPTLESLSVVPHPPGMFFSFFFRPWFDLCLTAANRTWCTQAVTIT